MNKLSHRLHKKKSDVIRDAISFYFSTIENTKKDRMLNAVNKVKDSDKKEYQSFEGTLSDAI